MWEPVQREVSDFSPVAIEQSLEWGGDNLTYPNPFSFSWDDFVLSTARTTCLRFALPELSHEQRLELAYSQALHLCSHLSVFIERSSEFLFSRNLEILADDQRTSMAGTTGTAISGLVMEKMGFHWSANFRDLKPKRKDKKSEDAQRIPDFVYDPAGQFGFEAKSVVVVEAKGSLSQRSAKKVSVQRIARDAYNGQVRAYVGRALGDLRVAGGLGIAFGTVPGSMTSTLAIASSHPVYEGAQSPLKAYALSAAVSGGGMQIQQQPELVYVTETILLEDNEVELDPPYQGGGGGPPGGGFRREYERMPVNGRLALANYEAVFLLCGAMNCARALRHILSGGSIDELEPETLFQDFWIYESKGMSFLNGPSSQYHTFGQLAIFAQSAEDTLKSISISRSQPPETILLRSAPSRDDDPNLLAIQGDGFAAIDPRTWREQRRWDISKGSWIM